MGSSQREFAGGGRGSLGNVRATHLAFSTACAVSLPAPDPAAITFRPPARKPWFGTLLAVWCRAPGVVPKTYDVFDPRSSEKVIATLSALAYPPAPRRHEASKWQS